MVEDHTVHVADILDNAAGEEGHEAEGSYHLVDNSDYNRLVDILEEVVGLENLEVQAVQNSLEDTGCSLDRDKVD